MNERIRQLMDQAGIDVEAVENLGEMPTALKFAELIVRECVAQNQIAIQSLKDRPEDIPGWKTMMNLAQVTCKLQIGKHFEVDL